MPSFAATSCASGFASAGALATGGKRGAAAAAAAGWCGSLLQKKTDFGSPLACAVVRQEEGTAFDLHHTQPWAVAQDASSLCVFEHVSADAEYATRRRTRQARMGKEGSVLDSKTVKKKSHFQRWRARLLPLSARSRLAATRGPSDALDAGR